MQCQVQLHDEANKGGHCGRDVVAVWHYSGPSLAMCQGHDGYMLKHIKECEACRSWLQREPVTT